MNLRKDHYRGAVSRASARRASGRAAPIVPTLSLSLFPAPAEPRPSRVRGARGGLSPRGDTPPAVLSRPGRGGGARGIPVPLWPPPGQAPRAPPRWRQGRGGAGRRAPPRHRGQRRSAAGPTPARGKVRGPGCGRTRASPPRSAVGARPGCPAARFCARGPEFAREVGGLPCTSRPGAQEGRAPPPRRTRAGGVPPRRKARPRSSLALRLWLAFAGAAAAACLCSARARRSGWPFGRARPPRRRLPLRSSPSAGSRRRPAFPLRGSRGALRQPRSARPSPRQFSAAGVRSGELGGGGCVRGLPRAAEDARSVGSRGLARARDGGLGRCVVVAGCAPEPSPAAEAARGWREEAASGEGR